MTDAVQVAYKEAVAACIDVADTSVVPSVPGSSGFVADSTGFSARIENPRVLGRTSVNAARTKAGCVVYVSPIYPVEVNTIRSLTHSVLAAKGVSPEVVYRSGTNSGAGYAQTIVK
ncbi:hypothetical protein [Aliiroseovarius subalbicans]|uniref:hypothetical protein n=1 Tax=Aliiroseovarius subalbicans TaxID=2925840 RepID=UPI001F5897D4|nr:hypothetical protein [Aliiroseovarius subalbicans]MCI2400664.1 hypothetical protein [Aliiroseovarius subalbicans]